jgi:hypothetical protein
VRTCIGDVRGQEREERGTGGAVLCELSLPPRYEYVREEEATRRVVWRRRRHGERMMDLVVYVVRVIRA